MSCLCSNEKYVNQIDLPVNQANYSYIIGNCFFFVFLREKIVTNYSYKFEVFTENEMICEKLYSIKEVH